MDLGEIRVRFDGSFARPEHNPLAMTDSDGDGMHDIADPDALCGDVEDTDHDGFFDDDLDRDGDHDDGMDMDGFHDDLSSSREISDWGRKDSLLSSYSIRSPC